MDLNSVDATKWLIAVAVPVVTAVCRIPFRHLALKRVRFQLHASQRRHLFSLLKNDKWKSVSAAELELGFADAFGFGLDADVVRHVLDRRNVVEHISYLKRCRLMVQVRRDGTGLERTDGAVRDFHWCSGLWMVMAITPYLAFFILSLFIDDNGRKGLFACIVVLAYLWMLFAGWMSLGFDAAHQVTVRSEGRFPLDDSPSRAVEATRRTRSPRQRSAATGAGSQAVASTDNSGQRSVNAAASAEPASTKPKATATRRRATSSGAIAP